MSKQYPEGTRFRSWSLLKENGSFSVRRWIEFPDGKQIFERLSKKKYSHLLNDQRALEDFVIRLNNKDPAAERTKLKVRFKHAFISEALLQDYLDNYLPGQIPDKRDAKSMFAYLQKYGLGFFIAKMDISDPLEWHRQQHIWGKYLLNHDDGLLEDRLRIFPKGEIRASKVLRYIVNELNRFIRYLHMKRPGEVSNLTFDPISKAVLKEHEARRQLSEDIHTSKYIKPDHWDIIASALEVRGVSWRWPVYLSYYYGLRRNEALGLKLEDIRRDHLYCQRQLRKVESNGLTYDPLKSRKPRKIPHWFISPEETYKYIDAMHKSDFIHPDTLSTKFSELVASLELPAYVFHDLRRCFITNAVKKEVKAEELRQAAGHGNIETTYKYYVMDARELGDEVWVPKAS